MDELVPALILTVEKLLPTNLGLLFTDPHKSAKPWNMVRKISQGRLVVRKKQYLSKGGRLTLLKGTLFSLPIYFMLSLVVLIR